MGCLDLCLSVPAHATLSTYSDTFVIKRASWARMLKCSSSQPTRAVTRAIQQTTAMGGLAAYLVRGDAPRMCEQGSHKKWRPFRTRHCSCCCAASSEAPHAQLRVHTSDLVVHSVFCRYMDSTATRNTEDRGNAIQRSLLLHG